MSNSYPGLLASRPLLTLDYNFLDCESPSSKSTALHETANAVSYSFRSGASEPGLRAYREQSTLRSRVCVPTIYQGCCGVLANCDEVLGPHRKCRLFDIQPTSALQGCGGRRNPTELTLQ